MVVFTKLLILNNNNVITTDFGRTQARIEIPFKIPLDPGQEITENIMFLSVQRIGGFSPGKVRAFINGQKIFEADSLFGATAPIGFDKLISNNLIKIDGSTNIFEVRVEQGPIDGLNTWDIFSQFTYNGNTAEPPTEPPEVDPPIITDPTGDLPPPEQECELFDIQCKLFGNTEKTFGTVLILAGFGIAVFGVAQVAKLIRG